MTDRMRKFLKTAAECRPGKGWPPAKADRRIASKAVEEGYGMMLGITGLMLFIINDAGRAALAESE